MTASPASASQNLVRREDEAGVVILTLAQAQNRNALGLAMIDTLIVAFADIAKERYNCNVETPRDAAGKQQQQQQSNGRKQPPHVTGSTCVAATSSESHNSLSFDGTADDALTQRHETRLCVHVSVPFRTRDSRGILYAHVSDDGANSIMAYMRRGHVNVIVRDSHGAERELELDGVRVDDGRLHKLDIYCESAGYLVAHVDQAAAEASSGYLYEYIEQIKSSNVNDIDSI